MNRLNSPFKLWNLWRLSNEARRQSRFDPATYRQLRWAGWYPGRCVPLIGWENSLNDPAHAILSEFGRLIVSDGRSEHVEIDYIKSVDCGFDGATVRLKSLGLCPIANCDCTWFVDRSGVIYSGYAWTSDLMPLAPSFDEALANFVNRRVRKMDGIAGYHVPSGWGSIHAKPQ